MCGIAGIAALDPKREVEGAHLAGMLECLAHRGPDDSGRLTSPGIALGHRRLSVIDPKNGRQPLAGAAPTTHIVINGEIYNFRELRAELTRRGHRFVTRSDSEVAAHAYDDWGLDFLDRLEGMFALAIWDGARRRLVLARDRMGEKPLYYSVADGLLVFGSELRSILRHPSVGPDLDHRALSQYLLLEYVPAPRSMIEGVRKLEPGTVLTLEDGRIHTRRYWSLDPAPTREPSPYRSCVARLRDLLEEAVRSQLVSDVPLGVFLSGGIDSSTVAAMAARQGEVSTFSIGFDEPSFDESPFARAVADHIGSVHHERTLVASEVPALCGSILAGLDEPVGDASIIPTTLLSGFAREHVTVALGGDGGDELFAGYPMHRAHRVAPLFRALPRPAVRLAARVATHLPVSHADFSTGFKVNTFLRGAAEKPPLNHLWWMSSFTPEEQAGLLTEEAWAAAGHGAETLEPLERIWSESDGCSVLARATHFDARTYLPGDILHKVDRASMSVSLEVRAPFLAAPVVEFAFDLPDRYRMRGLRGKRILRDAVSDLLPDSVLARPKKGFGMPVGAWLRGPLRPVVDDLLNEDALREARLFRPRYVRRLIDEHDRGVRDHRKPLWTLLAFEMWRRGLDRTQETIS